MVILNLSDNRLKEVPIIKDDVTEFILSNNQINQLNVGIFPAGLIELNLDYNQISQLDAGGFSNWITNIKFIL